MNPDEADYRKERLFYTRENALHLDAARNHLESDLHSFAADDDDLRRCLMLASIIYEAATRMNTSGGIQSLPQGIRRSR